MSENWPPGTLLNPTLLPQFHRMSRLQRSAHLEDHDPGLSVGCWFKRSQIDTHRDQHDRYGWGHKHDA